MNPGRISFKFQLNLALGIQDINVLETDKHGPGVEELVYCIVDYRSQQHARHLSILDPHSDTFFRSFWERAQEKNEDINGLLHARRQSRTSEDHQMQEGGRHF